MHTYSILPTCSWETAKKNQESCNRQCPAFNWRSISQKEDSEARQRHSTNWPPYINYWKSGKKHWIATKNWAKCKPGKDISMKELQTCIDWWDIWQTSIDSSKKHMNHIKMRKIKENWVKSCRLLSKLPKNDWTNTIVWY